MARPEFQPTVAQRRKVAIAAGGGMTHDDIACGIGISKPTLEKHFKVELKQGACERKLEALESMFKQAKRGNVAAAKAYIGYASGGPKPATGEAPGKKERAAADAKTAEKGTDWDGLLPSSNVTPIKAATRK